MTRLQLNVCETAAAMVARKADLGAAVTTLYETSSPTGENGTLTRILAALDSSGNLDTSPGAKLEDWTGKFILLCRWN